MLASESPSIARTSIFCRCEGVRVLLATCVYADSEVMLGYLLGGTRALNERAHSFSPFLSRRLEPNTKLRTRSAHKPRRTHTCAPCACCFFLRLNRHNAPPAFDDGINGKDYFGNHESKPHFFRRARIEPPCTIQRFLGPTRLHFRALFLQYSFTVASVTSLPSKSDVSRAVYQLFGFIPFPTFACVSGYTRRGQ